MDTGMINTKECEESIGPRRMTLRERLTEKKCNLETKLRDVNEALETLDANPAFEKFHDIVGKAWY